MTSTSPSDTSANSPTTPDAHSEEATSLSLTMNSAPSPTVISTDRELLAWRLIESLSIEEILKSTPVSSVRNIKPTVRSCFQNCCILALERIRDDSSNVLAWKHFYLIPSMVLSNKLLAKGGKNGLWDIRAIYHKFLDWQWNEHLHVDRPSHTAN